MVGTSASITWNLKLYRTTSLQHAKMVYVNDIMHNNSGIKPENIYITPIYMYARLGLGLYGLYIGIYTNIEACTQKLSLYAYIYIYKNTLESWHARLNLAWVAPHGYRKLWYITLNFYIY